MSSGGRDPLLRLLGLARPWRRQLLLAVAAGAAATGCGVALLAVSGFPLAVIQIRGSRCTGGQRRRSRRCRARQSGGDSQG